MGSVAQRKSDTRDSGACTQGRDRAARIDQQRHKSHATPHLEFRCPRVKCVMHPELGRIRKRCSVGTIFGKHRQMEPNRRIAVHGGHPRDVCIGLTAAGV
jgi:hypothetical protein